MGPVVEFANTGEPEHRNSPSSELLACGESRATVRNSTRSTSASSILLGNLSAAVSAAVLKGYRSSGYKEICGALERPVAPSWWSSWPLVNVSGCGSPSKLL